MYEERSEHRNLVRRSIGMWDFFEVHVLGNISIVLFGAGLFVAVNEVISRYIFMHSFAWSNELVVFILVIAVLLNYGLAQRSQRHIRVNLFVLRMRRNVRNIFDIFAYVTGIFLCGFLILHGVKLVYEVWRLNFSTEVLRIPTCIGYGVFVFAFILLFLRFLLDIRKIVVNWNTKE
jgi:TRAP-type C4-dicarboxylate transport system permease small subunit